VLIDVSISLSDERALGERAAMKSLRTLLVELKQLPAEIGYILGWTGDILAVLVIIGSAILYVALGTEPMFALGGCIFGVLIFLIGRGLQYVLAPRNHSAP
jgi:hypothetical protein